MSAEAVKTLLVTVGSMWFGDIKTIWNIGRLGIIQNLCEFYRFFLCDFLGSKCFYASSPKFSNTLRPKREYSFCKQYIYGNIFQFFLHDFLGAKYFEIPNHTLMTCPPEQPENTKDLVNTVNHYFLVLTIFLFFILHYDSQIVIKVPNLLNWDSICNTYMLKPKILRELEDWILKWQF